MKKALILIITCMVLNVFAVSFAKEVPFTQDDRDRLIRLEINVAKLEEGQKSLQRQIEEGLKATNQRIDTLQTFMLWGFGILFGGMGILIGFVIWDRRTALAPAIKKNKELEEREEKIERALKELAEKDPKVAEVLKHVGLL